MENARLRVGVLYAAWLALFASAFLNAWVSEDAYISLRVVENFREGYGLRWNIVERVQVFTHPLWVLLHLPFALVVENLYYVNIGLSVACASLAIAVVLLSVHRHWLVTLSCFLLPLFLSKCFLDYTSSGLETPLSYLLFSLFGAVIATQQGSRFFPLLLSLTASLLLLNRLDHALLIGPVLASLALHRKYAMLSRRNLAQLALGALPLVSWFAFSLVYYGFIFPNTKYAKLGTGFPFSDYAAQGMEYSFTWLAQDAASVFMLAAALVMAWCARRTQPLAVPLALGLLLNVAYIIAIGGDYMMGRFFAIVAFAACWLFLFCMPTTVAPDRLFAFTVALLLAYGASAAVREIRQECDDCVPIRGRIIDARRVFKSNTLFPSLSPLKMRSFGQHKFGYQGRDIARDEQPGVRVMRYVGMAPFYAGSGFTVIDELGLADALLARLPAETERNFYVGHYTRRLPDGYEQAVKTGDTSQMNPDLARYYAPLRLITQGEPLFTAERLSAIFKFNLGLYDAYRDAYVANTK